MEGFQLSTDAHGWFPDMYAELQMMYSGFPGMYGGFTRYVQSTSRNVCWVYKVVQCISRSIHRHNWLVISAGRAGVWCRGHRCHRMPRVCCVCSVGNLLLLHSACHHAQITTGAVPSAFVCACKPRLVSIVSQNALPPFPVSFLW